MSDIKKVVSKNLINLRKQKGLTQIELAKQICYSNKAISRWENGEVLPDIETLQTLSQVYNVPITYLLEEHTEQFVKRKLTKNEIFLHLTSICSIWILVVVLFVYLQLFYNYTFWQIFVWGIPATLLFTLIINKKWGKSVLETVLQSVFVWSVIAGVYLQFLSQNIWLIFLIGIPIQASIILRFFSKPKNKKQV